MNAVANLMHRMTLRKPVEHDEGKLAAQAERGRHAKALLEDELLVEAFEKVDAFYMDAFRNSGAEEIETRERAWTALSLLKDVRAAIEGVARDGRVAATTLERLRAR